MQDIYGKLEEPDGLDGLVRLRVGGPGLQDQILAAEKAGKWSEALALYEQALHPVEGDQSALVLAFGPQSPHNLVSLPYMLHPGLGFGSANARMQKQAVLPCVCASISRVQCAEPGAKHY